MTKEEKLKNKIVQQLKFHSISDKPMQETINDICSIIDDYNKHLTTEVTRLREALEAETKTTKRLTRGINLCLAAINGGLDGLELDNTCDVTENSFIIQQLKDQSEILTQALTPSK